MNPHQRLTLSPHFLHIVLRTTFRYQSPSFPIPPHPDGGLHNLYQALTSKLPHLQFPFPALRLFGQPGICLSQCVQCIFNHACWWSEWSRHFDCVIRIKGVRWLSVRGGCHIYTKLYAEVHMRLILGPQGPRHDFLPRNLVIVMETHAKEGRWPMYTLCCAMQSMVMCWFGWKAPSMSIDLILINFILRCQIPFSLRIWTKESPARTGRAVHIDDMCPEAVRWQLTIYSGTFFILMLRRGYRAGIDLGRAQWSKMCAPKM